MVDWTKLPEELLRMIAVRSFSAVELKRFRSICRTWRTSVSDTDNPLSTLPLIKLNLLVVTVVTNNGVEKIKGLNLRAFLSRASFFRVTLSSSSSSSSKGWLIKSDVDINLRRLHLLLPLSRVPLTHWCQSMNLSELTLTEIQQGCLVHNSRHSNKAVSGVKKVILVGNRVFVIGGDGTIRYWNGEIWTRIKEQVGEFCDIMVYKGLTYALDTKGIVWWIDSSLSIFRFGPSLDENITDDCCRDMSLMGCCEELYIVERLLEGNLRKRKAYSLDDDDDDPRFGIKVIHDDCGNVRYRTPYRNDPPRTIGFKVYKVDEELGIWVEVNSLKDNAVVMATDTCFSIVAREYYGCVANSIYFTNEKGEEMNVFKLEDGSIETMSKTEQSSFQMFAPMFL